MNKYLKAISYNYIFLAFSTIAFLILTPLAIRIMGDEFYGLWTIIFAIMQFSNIGTLGIGSIVNKFVSEKTNSDIENGKIISSAFIITLPMAFLVAAILIFSRNFLTDLINPSFGYATQFRQALIICAVSIIPQFISKIFQGYFLSQIMNKFVRTMDFVASIFPWVGGILISLISKNLLWISYFNLFVQIGVAVYLFIALVNKIKWKSLPTYKTIKRMLSFSTFMFLETSAITLFQQFDRILVGIILGPALAGVYSVGTSVGLRMSIVTGQATETMIPYASLKNSSNENEKLYQTFRRLTKYISLMIAGLASLGIIWMNEILSIWISPDYATKYSLVFSVLILAYGYLSLARTAHQTLTGIGHIKFTSITYLFASLIMLTSLFFLSKNFGLIGSASANLVMIILLIMNLWVYKFLNKSIEWKDVLADLKWGLLIPILAFIVIMIKATLSIRIGFSLLILIYSLFSLSRDNFIKDQLKQLSQKRHGQSEVL